MRISLLLLSLLFLVGCVSTSSREQQDEERKKLEKRLEELEKKQEEKQRQEAQKNTAEIFESVMEKWINDAGIEVTKQTTKKSIVETSTATASTVTTTNSSLNVSGQSNQTSSKSSNKESTTDLPWLMPLITLLLGGGAAAGGIKRYANIAQEAIDGVQTFKQMFPDQHDNINKAMSGTLSKSSQNYVKKYKKKEWADSGK